MEQILDLIESCKYLPAYELYKKLQNQISSVDGTNKEIETLKSQFVTHKEALDVMVERAQKVQATIDYEDNGAWTLGASYFGTSTYYRKSGLEDDSIILKMEGVMEDIPFFETLAVLHELDLFKEWVPFCSESKMIHKFSVADLMGYVNMGFPLFSRDTLIRAYGADCLESHGKLIILGNSILDYEGEHVVPFKKISWRHNRIECKEFQFVMDVLSPTTAKTCIMAHVNLNTRLPQSLINFLMKNLAGILLSLFYRQVAHVFKHPQCAHAERIRSNKPFYRDWLLPRLRNYCDLKSWEQPTIASLGLEGIPPLSVVKEDDSTKDNSVASTPNDSVLSSEQF